MIEAYVALGLLGVGYFINKKKPNTVPAKTVSPAYEKPSMKNMYESKHTNIVKAVQFDAVNTAYNKNGQFTLRDRGGAGGAGVRSLLTGDVIETEKFHNNMVPFIRGNVKQNMDSGANRAVLENFGTSGPLLRKKEIAGMFVPEKNVTEFDPTRLDGFKDRYVQSRMQNNVLPFDQVKVGPGVGQGFSAKPTGGFQQVETQQYAVPKTVDEMRAANNPKMTFEGRTVDGQKEIARGLIGRVDNNRVARAFETGPERYFKTTGAIIKPGQIPTPEAKITARQATSVEYKGVAGPVLAKGSEQRPLIRNSDRAVLSPFSIGGAKMLKASASDDYGKGAVQVYGNERDVTTVRTHKSNITSIVKAVIAPIQDALKIGKKEFFTEAPREFGQLSAQIPKKITVRDPNDVARTTIKETNLHDTDRLNVRGPTVRSTVYDPSDILRTTMKETTLQASDKLNMRGSSKHTAYDPNDTTRTTVKQTTLQSSDKLNVRGTAKQTVYDPNDVTRTTNKQTLLHDADQLNVRGTHKQTVHDPNDVTRTTNKETLLHDADNLNLRTQETKGTIYQLDPSRATVRQTVAPVDTTLNMAPTTRHVGTVHDPNDVPMTTTKETTLDEARLGLVGGAGGVGAYTDQNIDLKITQHETYVDNDYYGTAQLGTGEAYQLTAFDVKETMKQDPTEYFGGVGTSDLKAQMSYTDIYNATTKGLKEGTLVVEHTPTASGAKTSSGVETVNMVINKMDMAAVEMDLQVQRTERSDNIPEYTMTRSKQSVRNDDRLDLEILEPFKKNPYTKSLNSY